MKEGNIVGSIKKETVDMVKIANSDMTLVMKSMSKALRE